jgi:GMP synthase (glutamine-hydrolysing)
MKSLIAITHVDFENLGNWEESLSKEYNVKYVHASDVELADLKNANIDLLVVLGGPIGVYQDNEYPFIKTEINLLEERLKLDLPTLGICLGSQLMARALGQKVYPNHSKEIGWSPLTLTQEGERSCIHYLGSEHTSMFHWHGDTFDLPSGASLLASTAICKNQIFSFGRNALAFQCHPEVTAHQLEKWWIGHAAELSFNNISVCKLREQSLKLSLQLQKQSLDCLRTWIENCENAKKITGQ